MLKRVFFNILLLISILLVFSSGIRALDPHTAPNKYILHKWTTRDGLPQNTIYSIVQDRKGYLWLGTDRGIVRFDGLNFSTFNTGNVPAITNNSIISLLLSKDESLWMGTYGGGLTRYKNGIFKNYSQKDGLPNHFINAIVEDDEHNIWLGTTGDGVIRFNGKSFTAVTDAEGLSYNIVTSLFYDSRGKLWVGTERGLNCLVYKKGKPQVTIYNAADGLAGDCIEAIFEDRSGWLWIGTTNGISRIGNREGDLSQRRFEAITTGEGLAGNLVRSFCEDKDGNIWAATNGGLSRIQIPPGSRRIRDMKIESFTSEQGLSDNVLTAVYEDKWGNLWVGTSGGGVNMVGEGKFSFYTEKEGLTSGYTRAVYGDAQDILWIGTNGGGLNRLKDGKFTAYTREDGLSSNYIESIYGDRGGNLWIGTPNGLNRFKDGKFQVFTTEAGLSNNSIKSLFEDSRGSLWIGTFGGGLNRFKSGEFEVFDRKKGLSDDFVLAIEEDRFGNIWVGTNRGINCLEPGSDLIRRFQGRTGVPQGMILDIYCDYEGVMWIGTGDEGLVRYKDGVFTQFKGGEGFGSHVIYNIIEDNQENLWLSTNNGIFSVSGRRLNIYAHQLHRSLSGPGPGSQSYPGNDWTRVVTWRHFQEGDGLKTPVCTGGFQPAGWKTTNGLIWFPTIKGLAVMDLRRPVFIVQQEAIGAGSPAEPGPGESGPGIPYMNVVRDQPVMIEKVVADGTVYKPHTGIKLPVGTEKVEFYFTAIHYGKPGNILFKYRLEGHDEQWTVSSSPKSVVYLDLPAGSYEFIVMARPGGGDWNFGGDSCSFSIASPFHETFWFYFLVTIGLVFVFWGIPLLREIRAQKRKTGEEKYKGSPLTLQKSKLYLQQLQKIMEEEKPFLDPELSLQKLAERIGITREDLSHVINEQLGRNFKNFINEYRIEEAKRKLVDPQENQFVLLKIAFDVGFNSKSAFNASFKKSTGLSPSEYRKKYQETGKKTRVQ